MAVVEAADGSSSDNEEMSVLRNETTRGFQWGSENDEGEFFFDVRVLESRSKYESRTYLTVFCLQDTCGCFYNLQGTCFTHPCLTKNCAWSLTHATVMKVDAPKDRYAFELGPDTCVWHGGNHKKAALMCACVHFNVNKKFEQAFDRANMEEDEAEFAEVQKGLVLTR